MWAQYSLGRMYDTGYEHGQGFLRDVRQAARFYRLAADQGNLEAQCRLGDMYSSGVGVEVTVSKQFDSSVLPQRAVAAMQHLLENTVTQGPLA